MSPVAALAADIYTDMDDSQKMELLRTVWRRRTFPLPIRILLTVSIIDPESGKKLFEKLASLLKIIKPL